jgi:L-alanine-DL-glutamate epimerase-like enolase superfamily enzyme
MKITRVKTTLVDVPLTKPVATAIHEMKSVGCVIVELETDEDLTGESYVFTLNGTRLKSLHEMVLGFSHLVQGRDPFFVSQIWQEIWNEMNAIGHKGFSVAALSALDTACWDLIGKAVEKPLYKVFGACRDKVKTYASGGLWLSQDIDQCTREAQGFVEAGFRAMKIRLGSPKIEDDIARVRAIREAVGPEIELLADANQGFTIKHAIRLGRRLEEFSLGWFEEPVDYQNLPGHAEVRRALDIPVASGETEYTCRGMRNILEAGAVDVLMPDLQRIGGLSEFRRAVALAACFDIPVSTHLFSEHSICIAASEPNCISVEHMPWFAPLFNEPMDIQGGFLLVPDRPGAGFSFDQSAIQRYKIR